MAEIPNLAGIATENLVDKIGGGNFQASYINWARTLHLLRTHAPGWLPELVQSTDGGVVHTAPVGAFLMIRFRHEDGTVTPEVPQAVMDNSNRAIPLERVTARDVTDTHVRGVCKAAAVTFGLAYELWAKIKLESGYAEEGEEEKQQTATATKISPTAGVWDALESEQQDFLLKQAEKVKAAYADGGAELAAQLIYRDLMLTNDEIIAMWTQLPSNIRNQSKKFKDQFTREEAA